MQKEITIPITPVLIEDLGMQFPNEKSLKKYRFGIFRCSCGKEFRSLLDNVKSGHTKSCGCLNILKIKERSITHGMRSHKIYRSWSGMIQRCTNPKQTRYKYYGGRGIKVCDRWLTFENFRDDMLSTWKEKLSIDRIDNDGDYEPSNCRWATQKTQGRNSRKLQSNNTSGYRGVVKHGKRWVAQIVINCKIKRIGSYKTAIEGAISYDKYVIENDLEHTINGVI